MVLQDSAVESGEKSEKVGGAAPSSEACVGGVSSDANVADDLSNYEAANPLTPEQLQEAKNYNREGLYCDLADRAIDITYLGVMTAFFAVGLDHWLAGLHGWLENDWIRLAALFAVVTAIHHVFSFPLSFYSGHVLEHKYALSKLTAWGWIKRYTGRHALSAVFGLAMIEGLFLLIRLTGTYWWLAAAVAFFFVSVVMGQLIPVLIMPLFYRVEKLEDQKLGERFSKIAEGSGLDIEGVYRLQLSVETVKANAMLAGFGRTRRVILGDTLLDGFTQPEIEVIFAHEIGHQVHKHIFKMMGMAIVYGLIAFYLFDLIMKQYVLAWNGSFDYARVPVYVLPLLMLVIALIFQCLEPLINGLSRFFEVQADTFALRRTGAKEAYCSAFQKLARINKSDPQPHPLEVFLFHSHPPISKRIELADRVG